ncbi:5-(carboxyamino)imidazole ribonucleotide mutase [Desulfonatronovibrio magnus]|uniref:5-(carboxyamino)imidazole ribonucleotide mutase n=1 Tax=Desulfonatronovibrio magnus TaxID=698827 RepID=UPI000A63914F|nr:5-(carboxyamino)imidazole ribonucleotide mutase [Desulfonatronovibrio magnus]
MKNKAEVGIIMGSDSDLPVMNQAADILSQFGIGYELTIVSAHRTPERLFDYAKNAAQRGLEVIIAGAGGAAHLPGMVAACTTLPVIGVPINITALKGLDALLSIVQMPRGVPVATMAIDNAQNAGLLAARILGVKHGHLREAVHDFMQRQTQNVLDKAASLEKKQDSSETASRKTG